MKKISTLLIVPVLLVAGMLLASNLKKSSGYVPISSDELTKNEAHENYNKMMDVLTSPRCINCHPNDNIPKQGDDGHPHYFGMSRGQNNLGYQATKCTTCHQTENNSGYPLKKFMLFLSGVSMILYRACDVCRRTCFIKIPVG